MTPSRLDVFERAEQKAVRWLDSLMLDLGWTNRHLAYEALGIVLHVLRDRLPVAQAVHLGGHLPLLLRGLYYQNWNVSVNPEKYRRAQNFLQHVRCGLMEHRLEHVLEDQLVDAVAGMLTDHLSEGELSGIRHSLPSEIRALFHPKIERPFHRWLNEERAWEQMPP